MTTDRKREAREKFLLGGIVVKAGLSGADRAFLLGGLLELARVPPGSVEYQRLRDTGEQVFKATRQNFCSSEKEELSEWH